MSASDCQLAKKEVVLNGDQKRKNLQLMLETGVVAVVRPESSAQLLQVAQAIRAGGVNCIEIAMTTPGALRVIEEVAS